MASARLFLVPTGTATIEEPGIGDLGVSPAAPADLLRSIETVKLAVEIGGLESFACLGPASDLPIRIISNLKVDTAPASAGSGHVYDLSYTCIDDPEAAERVLESLIAAYEIAAERWTAERLSENVAMLEKHRKALFERLQRKQLELVQLEEANPQLHSSEASPVQDHRVKALVEARIRAELRRIDAEVKLNALKGMMTAATGGGTDEATGLDTVRLNALTLADRIDASTEGVGGLGLSAMGTMSDVDLLAEKDELRRMEQVWGPDHPKLLAAKTRFAELASTVDRQTIRSIRMAEAQVQLRSEEEQRLQEAIETHQASASQVIGPDNVSMQMEILRQIVNVTNEALTSVCKRAEQLSLASVTGSGPMRMTVLVPPNAPRVGSITDRPKLFLVPTGVGLLLGCALVYLRGSKPAVRSQFQSSGRSFRKTARRSVVMGVVPPLPRAGGRGSQRALGTWILRESDSKSAKALRRLGQRILRGAAEAEARCVLVTSAEPRVGKSVVLANVATAVAQMGRSVLLIDANYQHPSQHVLLSDILSLSGGPTELSVEALEGGQAAMRTQLETLRVVPAWPKPVDPSEILQSDAMRKFIRQSASNYD
ncbi:MAG: hypothetical protein JXA69_09875, partial [Phycisphaerae bacterium]|nr:hypothetical protein [Phycisphaerae bacterium]